MLLKLFIAFAIIIIGILYHTKYTLPVVGQTIVLATIKVLQSESKQQVHQHSFGQIPESVLILELARYRMLTFWVRCPSLLSFYIRLCILLYPRISLENFHACQGNPKLQAVGTQNINLHSVPVRSQNYTTHRKHAEKQHSVIQDCI